MWIPEKIEENLKMNHIIKQLVEASYFSYQADDETVDYNFLNYSVNYHVTTLVSHCLASKS